MPIGTKETIKLIIAILFGAAVLWGWQYLVTLQEAAESNEARGNKIEATSGILVDGKKADEDRGKADTAVAAGRDQFQTDYKEAKKNEPATADRSDRPVPSSVRSAFRARRLARERSGCVGDDCQGRPEDAPSAERQGVLRRTGDD